MKQDWRTIDTDLLVIGGGVAGSMAAIPALEAGLTVTICEKGRVLDNCGSVGCGVDHYLTVMESGPEWDTPEFLLKHVPDLTDGIVDMAVTTRVIHEMPRILRKIESMGVDFKDPKTGDYSRHRSFGLPGAYHINFDGTDFKRRIGKHVRVGKATVLTRTMAVQLLVKDNRAYGALAFGFRDGLWTAIRAKAVAVTTGDVNRISRNASGLPFDSWHFPYNTGDAQAMGYRAGAALANMEFVETTLTPKGFSAQGLNALVSLGAYFINKSGERFMFKYDPKGENARRAVLADAVVNEYLLGNGPIFVDCRHLPADDPRSHGRDAADRPLHAAGLLSAEGDQLPRRSDRNLDLGAFDPAQWRLFPRQRTRRRYQRRDFGRASVCRRRLRHRQRRHCRSGCARSHRGRGRGRAHCGRQRRAASDRLGGGGAGARGGARLDGAARGHALAAPSKTASGETVTDYVGVRRSEKGLRLALDTLSALAKRENELSADNLHGVMRVHEARNIRLNAEIMATAALARQETRTRSSHRRLDFPRPTTRTGASSSWSRKAAMSGRACAW